MKIKLIVWSKDRAVQLRLLLESIRLYMPNFFEPHIIYTYSNPDFAKGYAKVADEFPAKYIFESNLEQDTRNLINKSCGGLVAFSTDDTVIFQAPPVKLDESNLITAGCVTFSLRYGLNTTLQDHFRNLWQPPLICYKDEGEIISWPWNKYNPIHNYGYPFGLDMHIYEADLIAKHIKYERFKNSNELETLLFNKKFESPQLIRSFKESIAINIPDNNISGVTQSSGNNLSIMNQRFLNGEVIDLQSIPKNFNACHYPVEYKWVRR